MNAYEFMSQSPWLAFFLALLACEAAIKCWSRFLRFMNIRKNGWPPAHCDADGDFKGGEQP